MRRSLIAVLGATLAVAAFTTGVENRVDGLVLGSDIDLPASGPLGPVTVIGDSVLLGSGLYAPTLPDQLHAAGWGPIRFRAGVGYKAGPTGDSTTAGWWIEAWRRQGWDPPNVLVNLGANDSGLCNVDLSCARRRILGVVDAIGPGRRVWWPMITRTAGNEQQAITWNTALAQIAAERSDFFTWDWPAEMASGRYRSGDNTHLDATGYRLRSLRMAAAFTNDLARATRIGVDAPVPAPTAAPSTYLPRAPTRVVDTRLDPPGRRADDTEFAISLAGLVPSDATAVAINVTAAEPSADGYLSAGPCGSPNTGSTVNFSAGTSRGAMTVTPLAADGRVCIHNRGVTDVIVDLQGSFVAGNAGSGLFPLATNQRLLDTRTSGRSGRLVVNTPPGVAAVAVNLTVVDATGPGWLRAAPCDVPTGVSNVNFGPGEAVAGSAFVPTSAQNTICLDTSTSADVIVDLTGTFAGGGLSFVPVVPSRMLDTRTATGGWSPIHGAAQTLDVRVTPDDAEAVTGTLTLVGPIVDGYLVAHSCGPTPPTSSANAARGQVLANSLTTAVSDQGRLCVYSHGATHSLFDVTGWWIR